MIGRREEMNKGNKKLRTYGRGEHEGRKEGRMEGRMAGWN